MTYSLTGVAHSTVRDVMTLESSDQTGPGVGLVRLYRAVCDAEYEQRKATHRFAIVRNSVKGNWLGHSEEDAAKWGKWFSSKSGIPHDKIIAVKMPEELYNQFDPKYDRLDAIGP